MRALATVQAAVCAIASLLRVATRQHLGHQAIIVGRLVARMGMGTLVPVIGKDLLEDVPIPRGFCHHQVAPSWGVGMVAVEQSSHASPAPSTPHRPSQRHPHPPLSSLSNGDFRDRTNAFSFYVAAVVKPSSIFFLDRKSTRLN